MMNPQTATPAKYDELQAKMREARANDDIQAMKRIRKKLNEWGIAYGAYAPIR